MFLPPKAKNSKRSPVVVPAARNLDRVAEQSAGPVDVRSRVELLNRLRRLVRANAIDGRPPSEVQPQHVRYGQRRIVRARDRADSIEFPARKFPSRQSRSAESSEAFPARRTLRRASRQRTSTCPRASEARRRAQARLSFSDAGASAVRRARSLRMNRARLSFWERKLAYRSRQSSGTDHNNDPPERLPLFFSI